jgi:hypothetical protein
MADRIRSGPPVYRPLLGKPRANEMGLRAESGRADAMGGISSPVNVAPVPMSQARPERPG